MARAVAGWLRRSVGCAASSAWVPGRERQARTRMLLIGSLLGGIWFLLFVAAHVGTFATRPVKNRSGAILLLFGLALLGALLAATYIPVTVVPGVVPISHRVMAPLAALLVMACCFVLYMPFYYTIATSLSVQTVIAIDDAPGHQ